MQPALPVRIIAPLFDMQGTNIKVNIDHARTIEIIVKNNLNQWTAQAKQNPGCNALTFNEQDYEFVVTSQGKAYVALDAAASREGCFKGSRRFVKVADKGTALAPATIDKIKMISFANLFTLHDPVAKREFERELALHAEFKNLRKQGKATKKGNPLSHVVSGSTFRFSNGSIAIKTKNYNRGDIQHRLKEYNPSGNVVNVKMFRSHAKSIAKGLNELHSLKKVHMDVKPDNTVANTNKHKYTTARLIDLGKVRTMGEAYDGTSGPMGLYAPEAIRGIINSPNNPSYSVFTPQNDMYSYGLLLFFMACGKEVQQWGRDLDQMTATLRTGQMGVDAFLAKRDKVRKWKGFDKLPKKIQDMILACTAKDPKKRPTAASVVKQLKDWKV